MEYKLLAALGDNYLFNKTVRGLKPACTVNSKNIAKFAKEELGMDVQTSPHFFGECYTISTHNSVEQYFSLEDVIGTINTKKAKQIYNKIKNLTPAKALTTVQGPQIKGRFELEYSLFNGLLYGFPLCDIVEYLEMCMKDYGENNINLYSKSRYNYNKRAEYDYRIQRHLCSYCRKQYLKSGRVW